MALLRTVAQTYDLAPLIRQTRHALGLSQRRLAELLQVKPRTLIRWEYDISIPQPGYREWIAMELRRMQRTMPHRKNPKLNCGSQPGPKNIWAKLPPPEPSDRHV